MTQSFVNFLDELGDAILLLKGSRPRQLQRVLRRQSPPHHAVLLLQSGDEFGDGLDGPLGGSGGFLHLDLILLRHNNNFIGRPPSIKLKTVCHRSLLRPQPRQLLLFLLQLHEPAHPPRRKHPPHRRQVPPHHDGLERAVVLAAVGGPDLEVLDVLDGGVVLELLLDVGHELRVLAAVQQEQGGLLGDGDGGVDGHDGEEVGAEGVGQLHVAPPRRREEVDYEGGEDDPDRQDDVSEDVRVGRLHVDVLELLLVLVLVLHLLIRCHTCHAEILPFVDGRVRVSAGCLFSGNQIAQPVIVLMLMFPMLMTAFSLSVLVMLVLSVFMLVFFCRMVVMIVAVAAGGTVLMDWFGFMLMCTTLAMDVVVGALLGVDGFGAVIMGAVVVSGVGIGVQNAHDVEVAAESEEGSPEHVGGLLDDGLVVHADGGFDEELGSDDPDDGDVEEGAQRLQLVVAEGEVGRSGLGTHVDRIERDDVGEDVGEQVKGVGHDRYGVGHVPPHDLQDHEAHRNSCDLLQLPDHVFVLSAHRNYKPTPTLITTTSHSNRTNSEILSSPPHPCLPQRFPSPFLSANQTFKSLHPLSGSSPQPLPPSGCPPLNKRRTAHPTI